MAINFDKIIEDLYEGTLDSTAWNRAILSIADAVHASGAILFAFDPSSGALLRNEQHRVDPHAVSEYARYWNLEDLRREYAFKLPVGEPATEVSMAIPLKGTRFYNEYLLTVDMPHFMPVWLHKKAHKAVALGMQGSLKRGAFGAQDIGMLRRFLPHLARALEIRDRLEGAEIRASNFARVLETTTFGVLILDASCRVIEANSVAAALLLEKSGLYRERDGTLKIIGCNDDRTMRRMLSGEVPACDADALLHIPREAKLPLSVLAVPIPRVNTTSWLSGDPAWMLLVFDPERRLVLSRQVIMKDLALSDREAHVVSLLAAGLNINQIAGRLHVSVNTVRTQLHTAFQKAGCHSQADLTRRVLLGPGPSSLRIIEGR
jgi:DNA-binding CsgD family transcriptional regulator